MAGFTRSTRQSILNHVFKVEALPQPTNIYVALFTVAPTVSTPGTEVTGLGYVRILHNTWHTATAAEPSVISNDGDVVFPEAQVSWGTVVAFGIFDSVEGDNMLTYGAINQLVELGTVLSFSDGQLSVTLNEVV